MLPLKDENPISSTPVITWLLIVVNIVVFVWLQGANNPQVVDPNEVSLRWAAIPCEVITGDALTAREIAATFSGATSTACDLDPVGPEAFPDKPVRLAVVVSMFMHAGWLHLGGNMLFLWIFGNNIEDRLGSLRYLAFYLLGGIAASTVHIAAEPDSTIPVVGASGAVAAVMGAYLVWFPNAPIRTLIFLFLVDIRAKWWLGFWFLSQFMVDADSGIAWLAHVGGFVFGFAVGLLVRASDRLRRTAFTPPHQRPGPWDPTGGAGAGPYASPRRITRF